MKLPTLLLTFSGSVVAGPLLQRDYETDDYGNVQTLTTYTTVTTCPVTSTYTEEGTTYQITELTTSTMIVTDCPGCEQVTTVPGPTVTEGTTTEVEVTYETLCPTTETVYGPTETYETTHTLTSTVVTVVPTTIYESLPGEDVTYTETDVVYSTLTSVYPTTKVTTLEGEEKTVTYTTTELIETKVPTVIYETVIETPSTIVVTESAYSTLTSEYPVTSVTTISGEETTVTYTKTKVVETPVPYTIVKTISKPGNTVSKTISYTTHKSTYAITETDVVSGSYVTQTYYSTKTSVQEYPGYSTPGYTTPAAPYPTETEGKDEDGYGQSPESPTAAANGLALPTAAFFVVVVGGFVALL